MPNLSFKRRKSDHDRIEAKDPIKLKGTFPKIKSDKFDRNKLKNENFVEKDYYKEADLFLENQYFSIRSFQDDYESDNQNEFKEDEYLIDENGKIRSNKDDQLNLEYSPIPPINDYLYIPQLFRSKYEICIWKVDRRNVAKIKQSYVSPEVSIFKLLQFLFDILIVTS